MPTLQIGQLAPNFSLTVHDGSFFTLSEAVKKGPVVLVFYTMDGSPTCNRLLCRINADMTEFAAQGYQLVGINHSDPETHSRTITSKFLRLPLLSDEQFNVARTYDTLFEIGPIKVIRYSVVGIDQSGKILFKMRGRPTNQEILAAMSAQATPKVQN
jgi:peroxiredoxin